MRSALTLIVAALLIGACSGTDGEADTTTTTGPEPLPTTAPVTTSAPAPTTAVSTVTTMSPTTTAAPTTTTPPTTPSPTTTAAPTTTATTAPPGAVILLRPDGLSDVDFGASPAEAAGAIGAALGMAPTLDTGVIDPFSSYGTCPGSALQVVEFEGLWLFFTDAGYFAPEGTLAFFAWAYSGEPEGAATLPGIGIGATLDEVTGAYSGSIEVFDDEIFGSTFIHDPPGSGMYELLAGSLTGTDGTDLVTHLQGGILCGE